MPRTETSRTEMITRRDEQGDVMGKAIGRNGRRRRTRGISTVAVLLLALGVSPGTAHAWEGIRAIASFAGPIQINVPSAAFGGARRAPPSISVRGNRVSVTVEAAPLGDVLVALGRRVPFKVSLRGEVGAGLISITLSDVELERGVEQLLRGTSYVVIYGDAPATSASLTTPRIAELVVWSGVDGPSHRKPSAAGTATRAGSSPGEAAEAEEVARHESLERVALASPDLGERVDALRALATRHGPTTGATLAAALGDPDEDVRGTVLTLLRETGDPVPADLLARLARDDQSIQLRMQALGLLVERAPEVAGAALEGALHDPDAVVREQAERLRDDLGLSADAQAARQTRVRRHPVARPRT